MLPWTEIVKKETWVYNLQCSDCKHQLPTDHVEFSNKKCEVIHSNKKKYIKRVTMKHDFKRTFDSFEYSSNFPLHALKLLVYILSIFSIFLALNSYLHFFAFMCVYFSLYCLISNQLKVHFFSKHWVLKMHLTMADFLFKQIQKYKDINDNLHLSLSAY